MLLSCLVEATSFSPHGYLEASTVTVTYTQENTVIIIKTLFLIKIDNQGGSLRDTFVKVS